MTRGTVLLSCKLCKVYVRRFRLCCASAGVCCWLRYIDVEIVNASGMLFPIEEVRRHDGETPLLYLNSFVLCYTTAKTSCVCAADFRLCNSNNSNNSNSQSPVGGQTQKFLVLVQIQREIGDGTQ